MQGIVAGFSTIAAVIAIGYLMALLHVLDEQAEEALTRLAYFVATPCLLVIVVGETDSSHVLSRGLVATLGGVLAAALPYILVARLVWRRRADEVAIGAMCSAYCNAGNLGLPVAAYVLGDASLVAPMILLQVLVLQPIILIVLDAGRTAKASLIRAVRSPLTNPLTLATLTGVALSLADVTLPPLVRNPIELVGGIAVPGVLLAYGMSLRRGPLPGRGTPPGEIALVAALKLVAQPVGGTLPAVRSV